MDSNTYVTRAGDLTKDEL